jgi:DNA-binding CsgD family transcriptional regulator
MTALEDTLRAVSMGGAMRAAQAAARSEAKALCARLTPVEENLLAALCAGGTQTSLRAEHYRGRTTINAVVARAKERLEAATTMEALAVYTRGRARPSRSDLGKAQAAIKALTDAQRDALALTAAGVRATEVGERLGGGRHAGRGLLGRVKTALGGVSTARAIVIYTLATSWVLDDGWTDARAEEEATV